MRMLLCECHTDSGLCLFCLHTRRYVTSATAERPNARGAGGAGGEGPDSRGSGALVRSSGTGAARARLSGLRVNRSLGAALSGPALCLGSPRSPASSGTWYSPQRVSHCLQMN